MRRLLLTRPAQDNAVLAERLAALGIETVSSPLLTIERVPYAKPSFRPDSILLTSRHAAYACADFPGIPVYAVGEQTAEAASAQGCGIRAVAEDASRLLPHIPQNKSLLYFSGEHISFDFSSLPHVERVIVYSACAAGSLTPEAAVSLRNGSLEGVAFYSSRSATIFHTLTKDTAALTAYCLSPAVAKVCGDKGSWRRIETASSPNQEAMLRLLAQAK